MNVGTLSATLSLDSRAFMTGLSAATKGSNKLQGAMDFLSSSAGRTALAIGGVGLAATLMAKAIAKSTEVGAKFENEMRKVQAVSRATEAQYEAMSEAALDAAKVTMWTATQSASAMKFLAMAGFDANQAMEALPSVLQLATAGMLDVASAADITTNIMSGFGMTVDDLQRANNVIVATATSSNTSVEELGEAMKYAAPVAHALGYSIEDTAAMMSILANAGIKGSMAGTNMAQSLLKAEKAAKAFGIEGGDVLAVISKMKDESATVIDYQKTFGLIPLKTVLVMRDNIDAIKLQTLAIKKANLDGVAAKTANTMEKGVIPAWQRLMSAGENLGVNVFGTFSDELASALDEIASAINTVEPLITGLVESMIKLMKVGHDPIGELFPKETADRIKEIMFVVSLGTVYTSDGYDLISDRIAKKNAEDYVDPMGKKPVYNDGVKDDDRLKYLQKVKEEYLEFQKYYKDGRLGAEDPGDWVSYWEVRDPSKNMTPVTTDAVSDQIMDLLEKQQKLEESAKDYKKAVEEGWTTTYERKIGKINTELDALKGKEDDLSSAKRAALESERDDLNAQNDYASFVELDKLKRESDLSGLEGTKRKRKEAELELDAVMRNTAATLDQKSIANEIYDLKIKEIEKEERLTEQKKAQLLLKEQEGRLESSDNAVVAAHRQAELASIKLDLDKQLKQNLWDRVDAVVEYNQLLEDGKITQTQYNRLVRDAKKIEQDRNTVAIATDADRRDDLFKAKMKSLSGRIKSANDQSALDGADTEYQRDIVRTQQEYRDILAEIDGLEVDDSQRQALIAKADAWKQVADAASLAKEQERQSAADLAMVTSSIQSMSGAVEGPLADSFESLAAGSLPDLTDMAGAMMKELQLTIAKLAAELTAQGLFHSVMSFVDQANTAYHAAAAARAYSGAAVMATITAGSFLGSQFHAGVTELGEDLDNVSLIKGERVVDADTNQDLKSFLAGKSSSSQSVSVSVTQQFPAGTNYGEIAQHAAFIKEQAKQGVMEGIANLEPIADSIASVSGR
ncbi:phage tail tape measure protein [Pseudodesulfovibrio thermohalotolerans]|uniref:phage tail tape measure protein n=1 Tax=Pseudodesulfovibrio thermohalotolerans TaxID=2880651 RepID=UPI0024424D66|nr:phage tail tape measure protein [Pseudodesulfovibrio thermohalotolerans]WFS64011.1 phage tail tape measure protein [Pseudodesulfovibrio thermohalotolerans]